MRHEVQATAHIRPQIYTSRSSSLLEQERKIWAIQRTQKLCFLTFVLAFILILLQKLVFDGEHNERLEHVECEMPHWFLGGCVKTSVGLKALEISLHIRNDTNFGTNSSEGLTNSTTDSYEVSPLIYQSLLQSVSLRTSELTQTATLGVKVPRLFIDDDGIMLRVPSEFE